MKEAYKMVGHKWIPVSRKAGKMCCVNCGFIRLNNPISKWADQYGCNHKDHPQYESKLKQCTSLWRES